MKRSPPKLPLDVTDRAPADKLCPTTRLLPIVPESMTESMVPASVPSFMPWNTTVPPPPPELLPP